MNHPSELFDFVASAASLQSAIENRFGFDWNKSNKKIVEMERYYPVFRAPHVGVINWYDRGGEKGEYTEVKQDYEEIELDKYALYGWPPATIVLWMGYGSQTNTFVFCNVSEYPSN